jgi:hypothetical protein
MHENTDNRPTPKLKVMFRNPTESPKNLNKWTETPTMRSGWTPSASSIEPRTWSGVPLMPSLADQIQELARVEPTALLILRAFVQRRLAKHDKGGADDAPPDTSPRPGWRGRKTTLWLLVFGWLEGIAGFF